ncbi:RNA methyltransferase [Corynebacterium sp. P3-F1]|uniref:TrmH family RNA methyltransferase n=1 Tax=Corynebacterium sp. P3-F1 TaxID=3059080 RepID=UPI00265D2585|nr:RNA methyltransferase [Corynebacterium sp. P3-F1]WKK61473.1 RNA methyltransferase [Corynebacterium sp. P3-F1]
MSLDFSQPFTERTPRVVNVGKLNRAAGRRKAKAFLAEGENSVEGAVATGAATDLFVTEAAADRFADIVTAANYMDVFTHAITDKAAQTLTDTVHTTGIFAVCKPVTWTLGAVLKGRPKLVAVCVETNDPGNAGTIIRLVDALGADAVVFAGDTVDPESPKVVRSSAGSLFHVPVARERDIKGVLGQLRAAGLSTFATTMHGDLDLSAPGDALDQPTAWLFGNEAHGLPEDVLKAANHTVSIPIQGSAESLNLSTAASICLWESAKALAEARSKA